VIASPLRPRHDRYRASLLEASSPSRGTPYGASLSFATTTHLGPPSDTPSRAPVGGRGTHDHPQAARSIPGRALATSVLDSPCQGSSTGLTPPISTSVPGTPQLAYGSPVFETGGIPSPRRYPTLTDKPYATGLRDREFNCSPPLRTDPSPSRIALRALGTRWRDERPTEPLAGAGRVSESQGRG
jgi:hypothetical protein